MCWLFSEELIICLALYSGLNEGVMPVTTSQRLTHLFRNIWNRDVANVHIWEAETRLNWRCFFDWDKCIHYLIIQSFIYRNTFQFSSVQTWMAVHACVWRCNRCFCGKGNWENCHWVDSFALLKWIVWMKNLKWNQKSMWVTHWHSPVG